LFLHTTHFISVQFRGHDLNAAVVDKTNCWLRRSVMYPLHYSIDSAVLQHHARSQSNMADWYDDLGSVRWYRNKTCATAT